VELSQSVAALVGEEVLIAVPVDVARADQPLELFWRQLLAGGLPLQLSDDLVHASSRMNALGIAARLQPGQIVRAKRGGLPILSRRQTAGHTAPA
jgi:hypothetical protein